MTDNHPRYVALYDIAKSFVRNADEEEDNLVINENNLADAVNSYYEKLPSWKLFFDCLEGIDRYKIAALTAHYILKHPVIQLKDPKNNIAIYICANITYALEVALSRLSDGGLTITLGKSMRGRVLRLFLIHQNDLLKNKTATPEQHHALAVTFISALTILLEEIEGRHFDLAGLPL